MPSLRAKADGERPVRRLQHLGTAPSVDHRDHLRRGSPALPERRCTRRSPVERAPHAAHHGGDLLADGELRARALGDDPAASSPNAREVTPDASLGGMQLGPVQPNALTAISTHQVAGSELGARGSSAHREARRVEDDRSHGVAHPSLLSALSDRVLGPVALPSRKLFC